MNSFTFNDQEYVIVQYGIKKEMNDDQELILTWEENDSGIIIGKKIDKKDLFILTFNEEPNRPDIFYAVTKEYYEDFNLNFAKSLLGVISDEEHEEDEEDEKNAECKNLLEELEKRFDDLSQHRPEAYYSALWVKARECLSQSR